jgi:methylated-DNA-[protein]-cysteine S-methyltransferase
MALYFYDSPIGKLGIVENGESGESITRIYFQSEKIPMDQIAVENIKETPLLKEAGRQLQLYFDGKLKEFDLPLAPEGTDFMKKVWTELSRIPYGKTASYKEVAERIGNPKAMRAVGLANNRNPIPIIIPCHRVIGADGKMVGYGGGIDIKIQLLSLEADVCPSK